MYRVLFLVGHVLFIVFFFFIFPFCAPRGFHFYQPNGIQVPCTGLCYSKTLDTLCIEWCEWSITHHILLNTLFILCIFVIFMLPATIHMVAKAHISRYRNWLIYCEAQQLYHRKQDEKRKREEEERKERLRRLEQQYYDQEQSAIQAIYDELLRKKS